jgi:hypothetical protein
LPLEQWTLPTSTSRTALAAHTRLMMPWVLKHMWLLGRSVEEATQTSVHAVFFAYRSKGDHILPLSSGVCIAGQWQGGAGLSAALRGRSCPCTCRSQPGSARVCQQACHGDWAGPDRGHPHCLLTLLLYHLCHSSIRSVRVLVSHPCEHTGPTCEPGQAWLGQHERC